MKYVVQPHIPLLPYDETAATWHAEERTRLVTAGKTPAFVDGQIAAIAYTNNLTLVTNNTSDCQPITSEKDGAINFLIVVAEVFPEYAQIIEQALIQLEQQPTKLGSGANSFVANILIIALATAIILPDVEIERSLVTVGEEKQETIKIKVEGTGMEDIAAVLKAALPFVSSQ